MIKVLHLISGGDNGGAKTHIFNLMKGLEGKVDAKIICFTKTEFYDEAVERGIDIEVFYQEKRSDLSVVSKIRDLIINENYDLVHAHGARANFICMFLKNKIDIPMLTTIHSDYKLDFKDSFYKNLIFTSLNKLALKKFDYYICVSDTFKRMLIKRGFKRRNIYVLYNGIDTEEKIDYLPKASFFEKYKINYNGELVVGIVARLDKVKDHETFVRACKETLSKNTDIIFLIAGGGPEKTRIEELLKEYEIEDKVHLLGFVKDKYSLFNAMDVNVLTSISESFPYVILEAALLKVPTLATRVGGIPKIVLDEKTGFLFEVGDSKKLSESILKIYNDRKLLEELGENINSFVKSEYSHKAMGEKQFEIYKDILKKTNPQENNKTEWSYEKNCSIRILWLW